MRGTWTRHAGKSAVGMVMLVAVTGQVAAGGDDTGSGLFGRLFRTGNNTTAAAPAALVNNETTRIVALWKHVREQSRRGRVRGNVGCAAVPGGADVIRRNARDSARGGR